MAFLKEAMSRAKQTLRTVDLDAARKLRFPGQPEPLSGVSDRDLAWLRMSIARSLKYDETRLRNAFAKRHRSWEWRRIAVFACHSLRCTRFRAAAIASEAARRI